MPKINTNIYLPNDIRLFWEKFGKDAMFDFLRFAPEFIENYATFKKEALPFLEKRPNLMRVLSNEPHESED